MVSEQPSTSSGETGRRAASGGILVFLGEAMIFPTGILTIAYLTRVLGPHGYGVFTISATIILYLQFASMAYLAKATITYAGSEPDPRPVLNGALRLELMIDLAWVVLIWCFADVIAGVLREPDLAWVLRVFSLELPFFGIMRVQRDTLVGIGRYERRAAIGAGHWTLRLICIVIFVEAGLSVIGAAVGSVLAAAAMAVLGRTGLGARFIGGERLTPSKFSIFGVPIFVGSVAVLVFSRMDLFALKLLGRSTETAGLYAASQNVAMTWGVASAALAPVMLSTLTRLRVSGKRREAQETIRNGVRILFFLLPLVMLASAASSEIVALVFGEKYADAAPILAVLMGAGYLLLVHGVGTSIVTAAARPGVVAAIAAPLPVMAAIAHYIAIPRYGLVGAATVTTTFAFLAAIQMQLAVHSIWKSRFPLASVGRAAVSGAVVVAVFVTWKANGYWVVLELVVLSALAIAILLVLGELRRTELRFLGSLLRRKNEEGGPDGRDAC